MMTIEDRLNRLDTMITEGRIIRGQWTDGHERACLLVALAPECGEQESAAACPASVLPLWSAAWDRMTMAIFGAIEAKCAMRQADKKVGTR